MNFVFDFGAVLFTWKPADLLAETFPQQAHSAESASRLAQAMFDHADWNGFDQGLHSMEHVIASVSKRLGLDEQALSDLVTSIGERLLPIPQTVALLEQLHAQRGTRPDLRLYYLSNMPQPYARELEQRHAFLKWFDGGIFSSDVLHIKPNPTIYQLLQARHALDPAQTVFIDDLYANVQAARAQGWHAIHFQSPQQLQRDLAAFGLPEKVV